LEMARRTSDGHAAVSARHGRGIAPVGQLGCRVSRRLMSVIAVRVSIASECSGRVS
jgi:hypothetical protein